MSTNVTPDLHTILDHVMSDLDHMLLFLKEAGFDIHSQSTYHLDKLEAAIKDFEAFKEWRLKYPQIDTLIDNAQILADSIYWETYEMYKGQVTLGKWWKQF